tara:strand:+ start:1390 stop:1554 length:165 start_codon:yes stop_codon:yes gene_type:complete
MVLVARLFFDSGSESSAEIGLAIIARVVNEIISKARERQTIRLASIIDEMAQRT